MGLFGGCQNSSNDQWIWILIIVAIVICCGGGNILGGGNSGNDCCCDPHPCDPCC